MAAPFSWALVGPGKIANRFAEAVQHLPDTQLTHVVGRDLERAQAFATQWSQGGNGSVAASTSLQAVLDDTKVDGVYIATPHAFHAQSVAQCLAAGKPVLCEKPLVPSVAIAQPLVDQSRASGVFLMEAMWTRFLPASDQVAQWLSSGAIGKVRGIQSSFCIAPTFDSNSRWFAPELAGGALLDLGIYNISMARWALQMAMGACPPLLRSDVEGVLASTGVDQRVVGSFTFADGLVSQWVCALDSMADNTMQIMGDQGCIHIEANFWEAKNVTLKRRGEELLRVCRPFNTNGFEYEIVEAMDCIRKGLHESPRIPHEETLTTLAWMDDIRAKIGVRYPFE